MAKAPTKTQILTSLVEKSGLDKEQVQSVLDALISSINETISDCETPFVVHGLFKIIPSVKPATEARFGVPNPFRQGETMDVAAKPERTVVKVRPLKGLKDMLVQ